MTLDFGVGPGEALGRQRWLGRSETAHGVRSWACGQQMQPSIRTDTGRPRGGAVSERRRVRRGCLRQGATPGRRGVSHDDLTSGGGLGRSGNDNPRQPSGRSWLRLCPRREAFSAQVVCSFPPSSRGPPSSMTEPRRPGLLEQERDRARAASAAASAPGATVGRSCVAYARESVLLALDSAATKN
jgi:hypothetical protein